MNPTVLIRLMVGTVLHQEHRRPYEHSCSRVFVEVFVSVSVVGFQIPSTRDYLTWIACILASSHFKYFTLDDGFVECHRGVGLFLAKRLLFTNLLPA